MKKNETVFDSYLSLFTVRTFDETTVIVTPLFFPDTRDSVGVTVTRNESGFTFTDCGRLTDYWEETYVDREKYADKIERICEYFDVSFNEDGKLTYSTPVSDLPRAAHSFGFFLQALVLLANVVV